MAKLQNALAKNIPLWRTDISKLVKKHGDKKISDVTVLQAYGGMRGVKGMVCDTSEVPPDKGLLVRNTPIGKLANKTPEDIFYLLCTVDLPSAKDRRALTDELNSRAKVPSYVWKVLEAMPANSHPMGMLDTAILCMQRESKFVHLFASAPHLTCKLEVARTGVGVQHVVVGVVRDRHTVFLQGLEVSISALLGEESVPPSFGRGGQRLWVFHAVSARARVNVHACGEGNVWRGAGWWAGRGETAVREREGE